MTVAIIRRKWSGRLRSANGESGLVRKVLDGRESASKSAMREAKKTGLSLHHVYMWRMAGLQADILIARAAIKAIDDAQGGPGGKGSPAPTMLAAHREQPEPPGGISDQRSLF